MNLNKKFLTYTFKTIFGTVAISDLDPELKYGSGYGVKFWIIVDPDPHH
jgi:hypothetical protein